jgi:acyl-CoA synthetase (NDP forming)/RimJ/RimL family protein N-acetyltransferase
VTALDDRPYPSHWEADVVLADGGTVHLRPILPEDAPRLVAFHGRLSAETIYYRFFAPYPVLSDRDVKRFTHVDHRDRVALVATVGEDLIGVVRYDRSGPEEAEVAFSIEDAHQGRGLGTVLLEHCAAAARERGIRRFRADVLPSNRRMINVFEDAGYRVTHDFEDGIVQVSLHLEPTETSVAVMQAREHRAEARSVQRLLRPSSVVVVGAGRTVSSIGRQVLDSVLAAGFDGPVVAVNRTGEPVAGVPAYTSVADIPHPVDLAVLAVPAETVQQVVLDCARRGVRGLVVMSAGYGEVDEEGRERQRLLVRTARANGMRVVGPNSFGMINTAEDVRLNASLSPALPAPGCIGFFSQSGVLGLASLQTAQERGLGLSTFVSAGNRADISGNDLMQYWQEDAATEVVLLYLESIGNPRKFTRIARRVSRVKPIVAVKSGRFTQGVPLGHSVRVSDVPPAAVEALFDQAGVVRVDTLGEMFDVAQVLTTQPLPDGDRVAVVGNSDALTLLAADAVSRCGMQLVGERRGLRPDAPVAELRALVAEAMADPAADAVVVVLGPPLGRAAGSSGADSGASSAMESAELTRLVADEAAGSGKTVVATVLGLPGRPAPATGTSGATTVPSYTSPEDAVRALAASVRYAEWRRRPIGTLPDLGPIDRDRARAVLTAALAAAPGGADLTTEQLTAVLACYGIELEPMVETPDADAAVQAAAALGYPVVLKTMAEALRHRPDLAAMRLNLNDEQDLRHAYADLVSTLPAYAARRLVLQRMAPPGVVAVLRCREDALFGPIVSFGVGGVATELLGDRAYRSPPLTDLDVREMVRTVKAAPLLFGYAGADPVDVAAVEELLARLSRMADELPEMTLLELNPVLVGVSGAAVLGALGRVAPPPVRGDRGPRSLRD